MGLLLYLALFIVAINSLRRIKKLTRAQPNLSWMRDLAAMLQVSLGGYIVAGSALPLAYFELFFQLLALVVVLQVLAQRAVLKTAADEKVEGLGRATAGAPLPRPATQAQQRRDRTLHKLPHW